MVGDPLDDHSSKLLYGLDLNEYETRAYLSILEGGVVVAREVSDRASIPYAKVYQTLNALEQKQLILGDEGRPKKFQARDPEDAVNDRLQSLELQWKQEHELKRKHLDSILPDLKAMFENSNVQFEQEEGVWNIVGLSNILSRINKLLMHTLSSLLIVSGNTKFLEEYLIKTLDDTSVSGEVILICPKTGFVSPQFTKIAYSRHIGKATRIFFDNFAMFTIVESRPGKFTAGEYHGVLTQIQAIVESSKITYEAMIGGVLS